VKPVKQTRTGPKGNCFQACVASVLELPLEAIPDFCNGANADDWFQEFSKWILRFNLSVIRIETGDMTNFLQLQHGGFLKGAYMLAGGKSAVRGVLHEVVYYGDKMVHDPAPEGKGLEGEPIDYIVFIAHNPADCALKSPIMCSNVDPYTKLLLHSSSIEE